MTDIVSLGLTSWRPELESAAQQTAIRTIEGGGVLVLPRLSFELSAEEVRFLSPTWSDGRAKNISLDGAALRGAYGLDQDLGALARMIERFGASAGDLVTALFPRYAPYVKRARTSFRPQPAVGRPVSWRKDDARLHIDAFPSRPNHGERILRVFSNVNPVEDRVWRVGEAFATMAQTFLPRIGKPMPGIPALLAALRVTKGVRSEYDHLMLGLHDNAKADLDYQRRCEQQTVHFAPGTTWLCFSDQVMHAAVSGQHMLEQTIHLPVTALYDPGSSPLAILERLCGRRLLPAH
ncbi:MAG: 3-deoxy-D-manno-oct-2-ulosonic acid (Kdo) hydroxylase [Betaproteobacteria bacterium]|nr:MAG: 3-deoxy-D-manno-oct-2-ulosonic acid (Kdo) hydroxylase [Betaproteobacteria bacterium]